MRKRGSTLSIESVQGYHAGNYSCQATNHADTVSATTELAVKGLSQNSTTHYLHGSFNPCICTIQAHIPFPFSTLLQLIPELPEIEPFSFSAHGFNSGGSAKTMCTVTTGDSPLDIYWLKDGRKFDSSNIRRLDEYSSILSIRLVTISDAGNYTCVAKNRAGVTEFTGQLVVKGGFNIVAPLGVV